MEQFFYNNKYYMEVNCRLMLIIFFGFLLEWFWCVQLVSFRGWVLGSVGDIFLGGVLGIVWGSVWDFFGGCFNGS